MTKKQFMILALPLIIGNIFQQLYNTIDALVIGHFAGNLEFASIGIAGSIMNLFIFAIVGFTTGVSILFAQSFGAKDDKKFSDLHAQTLIVGIGLTIFLSILVYVWMPQLLHVTNTPVNLKAFVSTYLTIICIGLPSSYVYNLYCAMLRSIGNTKTPLYILGFSILINIIFDLLFVATFHWNMAGAALATILAQTLSAILCMMITWQKYPMYRFRKKQVHLDSTIVKTILALGSVAALHQSSLYIGKVFVQSTINTAGTDIISAYTATTRIEGFVNSFGDSGAAITTVLVAQAYGAQNKKRIQTHFKDSFEILLFGGILCSLLLYVTSGFTTSILLPADSNAYSAAVSYLKIVACFYPLCFIGNTWAGYYDGIGKPIVPFMGAASHITMRVILSILWIQALQLNGVAIATGIGWIWMNVLWSIIYIVQLQPKKVQFSRA